jgi:phosphohistidine phosphatase SixA
MIFRMAFHRRVCLIAIAALALMGSRPASAAEKEPWAALRSGAVVLLRHASAPGTGDPAGFRIGDCATQRNLDDAGRRQAAAIGARFRAEQVPVAAVLSSEWCRTVDTAEIAFPGQMRREPAFNSFFSDRGLAPEATARARAIVTDWRGPGALVVVTHQLNITALTGLPVAEGAGIVVAPQGDGFVVVGEVKP